jgi:F0F1-type ATP synthase membrane subunit a
LIQENFPHSVTSEIEEEIQQSAVEQLQKINNENLNSLLLLSLAMTLAVCFFVLLAKNETDDDVVCCCRDIVMQVESWGFERHSFAHTSPKMVTIILCFKSKGIKNYFKNKVLEVFWIYTRKK